MFVFRTFYLRFLRIQESSSRPRVLRRQSSTAKVSLAPSFTLWVSRAACHPKRHISTLIMYFWSPFPVSRVCRFVLWVTVLYILSLPFFFTGWHSASPVFFPLVLNVGLEFTTLTFTVWCSIYWGCRFVCLGCLFYLLLSLLSPVSQPPRLGCLSENMDLNGWKQSHDLMSNSTTEEEHSGSKRLGNYPNLSVFWTQGKWAMFHSRTWICVWAGLAPSS